MTREEAITTLKEMHDSFDEIHENTNYEIGYEQMTATEMAIEALNDRNGMVRAILDVLDSDDFPEDKCHRIELMLRGEVG